MFPKLGGSVTLFLAVVIPEGLNFRSSFITDTLPFIAAMWTQVLPSCRTEKETKVTETIINIVFLLIHNVVLSQVAQALLGYLFHCFPVSLPRSVAS